MNILLIQTEYAIFGRKHKNVMCVGPPSDLTSLSTTLPPHTAAADTQSVRTNQFIISEVTMAVLSTTKHENISDTYEDTKPRWKNSLRFSVEKDEESKPLWKPGAKANSPSNKMSSEGGSLRTQRRKYLQ